MAIIGLQKGSGKRSRVREKSVKSQGILIWIMSGNPVSICRLHYQKHLLFLVENNVRIFSSVHVYKHGNLNGTVSNIQCRNH